MRRVLVIGCTGYVGTFLLEGLAREGEVVGVSRSTSPLSLDHTDASACAAILEQVQPDVIVHAAALSAPAECERDPDWAWRVNACSGLVDAVAAFNPTVRFVLLSTDQVHDGLGHCVDEATPALPVNVYGRTKLAMEQLVEAKLPCSSILRLSFVYGPSVKGAHGTFLQFALEKLQSNAEFTAFIDQVRSAVYVGDVVEAVRLAVQGELEGCVNVGGPEALSRYDFCLTVAEQCRLPAGGLRGVPAPSAGSGAVPSPADISMDTAKLAAALGRAPTALAEALASLGLVPADPRVTGP